jgi:glyoxylase-like metal-dependent hydrolase (beta-lactamase superfamily II)
MIQIKAFFHNMTSTTSYVVFNDADQQAVIIDPVLDFDLPSGKISTEFADLQLSFLDKKSLTVQYIFETHAHADHLTAADYLRDKLGAKLAVSET